MTMKNIKYAIGALVVSLALVSCSVEAPDAKLGVHVVSASCKAGEPVVFKLSGDPDNIVFYSGEPGHEYNLRDRQYADNNLMLDFVSYTDQSTSIHPNFQVLVSHDFDGVYEPEHVSSATWTDITHEFELPSVIKQNTPSGAVNLRNYAGENKDGLVYIAFRYYDLDGVASRNRWVVRSLNLVKISPEGSESAVANIKTAGLQNVIISGTGKWTLPGSQLLAAGKLDSNDKDMWAVSSGFNVYKAEPSTGVVLKNLTTEMSEFQYTYETPGEYEAVFSSSSVWYNSENSSVTSVRVKVTE